MKPIDYVLIGILAVTVFGAVIRLVKRKKQGKGGCEDCPLAGECPNKKHGGRKNE